MADKGEKNKAISRLVYYDLKLQDASFPFLGPTNDAVGLSMLWYITSKQEKDVIGKIVQTHEAMTDTKLRTGHSRSSGCLGG